MRFLADECVDTQLVKFLRTQGHDVLYVMEAMRGETDDTILAKAYAEERIILTEDKDFGELVFRLRKPAVCIILLRFNPGEEILKIQRFIQLFSEPFEVFTGTFIVVDANKTRIRPLQS
ncbi:MAG: DUF5615 family PIN-like protein [Caldilineaceae bacterium]